MYDANYNTLLHYASARGNMSIVKLLLRRGANPFAINIRGETPSDIARRYKYVKIVELLDKITFKL
jgi:ankyrin repeat protein